MSLLQTHRHKRLLQALLLAFLALFVVLLLLLRNAGHLSPSPIQLGLLALAPLGVSVAFLLLWRISWFGPGLIHSRSALRKLFFWLVAAAVGVFWLAFFANFVFASIGDAAA